MMGSPVCAAPGGKGGGAACLPHVSSALLCTEGSGDLNKSFIRSRDAQPRQRMVELRDKTADGASYYPVQLSGNRDGASRQEPGAGCLLAFQCASS